MNNSVQSWVIAGAVVVIALLLMTCAGGCAASVLYYKFVFLPDFNERNRF